METIQKSIQITFKSNDNSLCMTSCWQKFRFKLLKSNHTHLKRKQCHTSTECFSMHATLNTKHLSNPKISYGKYREIWYKFRVCVCVCESLWVLLQIETRGQEIYVKKVPFYELLPLLLLLFIAVNNNHFGVLKCTSRT